MKIADSMRAAPPLTASQATAPRKADAWQAQLERAWLESWSGDRPPQGQSTARPEDTVPARPKAGARIEGAERTNPAERAADCDFLSLNRPCPSNSRNAHLEPTTGATTVARPGLTCSSREVRASSEVSRTVGVESAAGSRVGAAPPPRPLLPLTAGSGDAAARTQAEQPRSALHHHEPGAAPSRTSLQVAVADGTAQVTLRDAALSTTEVSRLPQAIAHQLLETGLQSVRLYVNGRVSQHGRGDHSVSRDQKTPDIGRVADPDHITPLERK